MRATHTLLILVLASLCVGCFTMQLTRDNLLHVATFTYEERGKPPKMTSRIRQGQIGFVKITFTWDESGSAGGHETMWKMYHGERLVSQRKLSTVFRASPYAMRFRIDTTSYPTGEYRLAYYLDGQLFTNAHFTILKAEKDEDL